GAQPRNSADGARPRRRGDRISADFAALRSVAIGTKQAYRDEFAHVRFQSEGDMVRPPLAYRPVLMTQSGHERLAFAAMHCPDLLYFHDLGFGVSAMKRREFLSLLVSAAAWPLAARAQQVDRMRRVGVLIGSDDNTKARALFAEFQKTLEQLGWTYGRNIQIDIRWGSDPERIIAYT